MNRKLRVMVLTNEESIDSAPGQKDAIRILAHQDFIDLVEFVSLSLSKDSEENFRTVVSALENSHFDVLMIWSPKKFPETRNQFEYLIQKIKGRPIYYWEGDPWTRSGIKQFAEQSKWWAMESQIIFSVAKEPHTTMFHSVSHAKIVFIPQTYCHVQFGSQEASEPPLLADSKSVVMIGNQSAKIPFIYGTPGSGVRFLLGTSLKIRLGRDFHLYGNRWPIGFSAGTIEYAQQAKLIRNFSLSANWDNFAHHESYVSDRLPISLLAGRVHITNSHPGINYYGGEDVGLARVTGLREMHSKIDELRELDPLMLSQMGLTAHNWAKHRFSHREAARFMFSCISSDIPPPQIQPWTSL